MKNIFTRLAILSALMLVPAGLLTAQSTAVITTQLDRGSQGAEVTKLQSFLATNRSIYPEGIVSGFFGPLTEKAVAQFQLYADLPTVGRVGPLTMARINSIIIRIGFLDVDAPIVLNRQVSVGPNSATISWQTNENALAKVVYSPQPLVMMEASQPATEPVIVGQTVTDLTFKTSHSIALQNLSSKTVYHYVTVSVDASGNVQVTAPGTFTTN